MNALQDISQRQARTNAMLAEMQRQQSRWFMMMAVMTVLGLVFIGAAAWGMGRAERAYQAEQA